MARDKSNMIRLQVWKAHGAKYETVILGDQRIQGLELYGAPGDKMLVDMILDNESIKDACAEWDQRDCKCPCHAGMKCERYPTCCGMTQL